MAGSKSSFQRASSAAERPRGAAASVASAWSGGFSDEIKRLRKDRAVFVPPKIKHVGLERNEHFFDELRQIYPRKYMGKGVHKMYGGPVEMHASEFCFGVTLDHDRDMGRQKLEPGGGNGFSAGSTMAGIVMDKRNIKERMPKNKGALFHGPDGEWLKEMLVHGKYLVREMDGQIGHAAPGAAIGWTGKWPDPRSAADPDRFKRIQDKWGVSTGPRDHVPWVGRLV